MVAMGTAFTSPSSARVPERTPNKDHISSSTFDKTVCLQDWWLIRSENEVEGKRLGVGGLTGERPMRLFSSAPIIKRHDLFTLETADGITILIKGSVNRSRMHENGFRSEVCNHFLLGFPYYWEDFADQCLEKESNIGEFSPSSSCPSNKRDIQHKNSEELEHRVQRGGFEKSKTISGDVSKDFAKQFEAKAVSSSDIEGCTTEELSNEDGFVARKIPSNVSKRSSKDCSYEKMRIQDNDALKHYSLLKNSNVKSISPSDVGMGIGKHSAIHLRSLRMVENLSNRMKAICSSSKRPNVSSLVTEDCVNDLVRKKIHAVDCPGLSNINLDGGAEKSNLTTPNDYSPKCLADLRKCSGDPGNADALKDSPVAVDSDASDVNPSRFDMVVAMKASLNYLESSSRELGSSKSYEECENKTNSRFEIEGLTSLKQNNPPISSYRKLTGLARERKNATIADKYVSQENERLVVSTSQENLLRGNDEWSSDVRSNGVVDINLTVAPGHPVISERSGSNTVDAMKDPCVPMNAAKFVACSSKSGAANATMTTNTLKNTENKGGMNLSSGCVVNNGNGSLIVMAQAVEDPAAKHQAGRSASSEGKEEKAMKIMSSSELRRSSRLKGLKNINDMETERNNVHAISFDSNGVKSAADIMDGSKSGCGTALDFSSIQSQQTICESSLKGENVGSQYRPQTNSLSSSTPTEAVLKQNFGSDMNAIESWEQNEHCSPSIQLDDVSCKNDLEISVEGEKSHKTEQGKSEKRTKRKLEYVTNVSTPVRTRSRSKNITSVSPDSLSYKRSRSGRLLVPPLDFWRNQQVVYDRDGQITGVIPVVESNTGSKSEIVKKKKKFV